MCPSLRYDLQFNATIYAASATGPPLPPEVAHSRPSHLPTRIPPLHTTRSPAPTHSTHPHFHPPHDSHPPPHHSPPLIDAIPSLLPRATAAPVGWTRSECCQCVVASVSVVAHSITHSCAQHRHRTLCRMCTKVLYLLVSTQKFGCSIET